MDVQQSAPLVSYYNQQPVRWASKHGACMAVIILGIAIAIFMIIGIFTVEGNRPGGGFCCVPYNVTGTHCPPKVFDWIYCCDPESGSLPICDNGQFNLGLGFLISAVALAVLSTVGCTISACYLKQFK